MCIVSRSQLVVLLHHYSEVDVLERLLSIFHAVLHALKVLVDKLRALVTQNAKHLGTMKSLELLVRGNVVNQLKHFRRDHESSLVLYWDEERYEYNLIFMLYARACYHKISFAI